METVPDDKGVQFEAVADLAESVECHSRHQTEVLQGLMEGHTVLELCRKAFDSMGLSYRDAL